VTIRGKLHSVYTGRSSPQPIGAIVASTIAPCIRPIFKDRRRRRFVAEWLQLELCGQSEVGVTVLMVYVGRSCIEYRRCTDHYQP